MNLTELKTDFYRRYSESASYLCFFRSGLLCSLLGDVDIPKSRSLNCSLSMCVQVCGRAVGGDIIKLEDSDSNNCRSHHLLSPFPAKNRTLQAISRLAPMGISGAELLACSSIPDFFDSEREYRAAVVGAVLKINDMECENLPELCAGGENPSAYASLFANKKGWCTDTSGVTAERVPLPLTGFKLLSVQGRKKARSRSAEAAALLESVRAVYPHITSFSEVTREQVEVLRRFIKDKVQFMRLMHIVDENDRIDAAVEGLKRYGTDALFKVINASQQSLKRLWGLNREQLFMADKIMEYTGVKCARAWKNGIIAVVEEDRADRVIRALQFDYENKMGYTPFFCIADTFGD